MTQAAAQAAARGASTQPRSGPPPSHPPGPAHRSKPARRAPYLQLRGRTFYFRKRLAPRLARQTGREFLVFSLRTQFLSEAMRRAARLVVALEKLDDAMTCLSTMTPLTQDQANAILTEMLRAELAALLARYESGALFAVDPDLQDETLDNDADRLKHAARNRDFSDLLPGLAEAARTAGVTLADPLPTALGIQAASLKREVLEVTRAACDLEDPRKAAAPLVARFSDQDVASFVKRPVSLEAAIAKTFDLYPSKEMRGNIKAIASLVTCSPEMSSV